MNGVPGPVGEPSVVEPRFPVVVAVDAEPDGVLGLAPGPWMGLDDGFAMVRAARPEVLDRTGLPLKMTWMLRADRQVADVWGDAGWAFDRFSAEIDEVLAAGDFVGLHVHPLREEHGTEDYLDEAWTVHSLEVGLDAFERHFGRPPAAVSWGRGWTSNAVVKTLGERGVGIDMSVSPCRDRSVAAGPIDVLADVPDLGDVPRHPYYPSADDWRREAAEPGDRTWIMPYTSAGVRAWLGPIRRTLGRSPARGQRTRVEHTYLWATTQPGFARFVRRLAAQDRPYLTLNLRSSRFAAATSAEITERLVAVADVCRPLGGAFADPVSVVNRYRPVAR